MHRRDAGTIFERFVAMELLRQADWAQEPVQLFHYRDQQQREIDVILERNDGEIAGMEVKEARPPPAATSPAALPPRQARHAVQGWRRPSCRGRHASVR